MTWDVPNPKGRIGSLIATVLFALLVGASWLWWPWYLLPLFILLEALSLFRLYQEWVENGAWAK